MRISDWSSDVCSSDLAAARRHDYGAVIIRFSRVRKSFGRCVLSESRRSDGYPNRGRAEKKVRSASHGHSPHLVIAIIIDNFVQNRRQGKTDNAMSLTVVRRSKRRRRSAGGERKRGVKGRRVRLG